MKEFNPFSQVQAKPSLMAYIHSKISGYSKGRSMDVIHASDVTKPDFCARRRAIQNIERDEPKDEYLTTCQAKVFAEGRIYEAMVREEWCGDISVGNWECGWCGHTHVMMRKPSPCHHCRRPAPMIYREMRFESNHTLVSCGVDTLCLLPGMSKLTLVEVKTIASSSTQKSTPIFSTLKAALAEHHSRSSWYLKLIEESGDPLGQYIDLTRALIFYISKGFGEETDQQKMLGLLDRHTPFKEFWVDRDDQMSSEYDRRAYPLGLFFQAGVMPDRPCQSAEDPRAKKCPKVTSCFSNVYPAGQIIQKWRP